MIVGSKNAALFIKACTLSFWYLSLESLLIANFMALRADDSPGWSASLHFKSDRIAAKQERVGYFCPLRISVVNF